MDQILNVETLLQHRTTLLLGLGILVVVLISTARKDRDQVLIPYAVEIPSQCTVGWRGNILDRPELKLPGSSVIQCYCPASGRFLGNCNPASPSQIDRAIAKASEAQLKWARSTFSQRRKVLRTLLKHILDNQDSIARASCLDSGKTMIDASFGEILVTAEKLKWTIQHGEKALRPERRPTNLLMSYKANEVRWEPLGVVAACVSWNYPFHNLIGPIVSSIFSGNGIVVKGSEATAWSSSYFVQIVQTALQTCGHPPELVQSIICWPDVAPHLTSHIGISHLTFVGSRNVAHRVAASAAKNLIPACIELGGKDAAIILDDVQNLEQVASVLMRGVFQSGGQNCIGIERVIACPRVYDRLVDLLEPKIKALRVGNALEDDRVTDVGALISDIAFRRLEELVQEAVSQGASLLAGGKQFHHPDYPRGHYFQPTFLANVTPEMRIARIETFAPIFTLMKATGVDDAVRIANSTEYGLGASVFGSKTVQVDKVISGVKTGMVSVNDFGVYYAVQLPFGGTKGSGYGRFAGEEGLRSLCNTKAVCRDRFPRLMNTAIPTPLDYPIKNALKGWEMCKGIVELGYGVTRTAQLNGLWKIIRNS